MGSEINLEKYFLKSVSFYEMLDPAESVFVKKSVQRKEYKKGQTLYKEGSYSKGVYIVRKGKIKIYTGNLKGRESIIYIYKRKDFFGHRPLLTKDAYGVTAVAIDEV